MNVDHQFHQFQPFHPFHPSTRQIALAIAAFLVGIYLLTTGAHTSSKDEELIFGVTETLAVWGSFALNAARPDAEPIYSTYGPGQSIAMVPLYMVGKGVATFFPQDAYPWVTRAVVLWFNPLVTAIMGALIFVAAERLGFRRKAAIATALLFGLATLALPYSKTLFSEPFTALLLFSSFTLILFVPPSPCPLDRTAMVWLAISGVLAGLAPSVKIQTGILLPWLGLYAGFAGYHGSMLSRDAIRPIAVRLAVWGGSAAVMIGLLGIYQWSLFGSPFRSGYGDALGEFAMARMGDGLNGLIWSAGRGIIWYAPPLILFPVAWYLFWKGHKAVALLCGAMVFTNMLFHAQWVCWHGGGCWGPRFLMIAIPFMALPMVALFGSLRGWRTPLRTVALTLTLLLTLPVQIGSIAIANEAFFSSQRGLEREHFNPTHSALFGHFKMALNQLGHTYNIHFAPNRVVLAEGFSYSEGDRESYEHLPRWTKPAAEVEIRINGAAAGADTTTVSLPLPLIVTMTVDGCRHPDAPAAALTVAGEEETLIGSNSGNNGSPQANACPPRTYSFLLPPRTTTLSLDTSPWNPANYGLERDETLGVWLTQLSATVAGQELTLTSDLVPITPMPTGFVSIRRWTGDHRYGHWDVWWWYLAHSDLPRAPRLTFAISWAVIALALAGWGGQRLWRAFFVKEHTNERS